MYSIFAFDVSLSTFHMFYSITKLILVGNHHTLIIKYD